MFTELCLETSLACRNQKSWYTENLYNMHSHALTKVNNILVIKLQQNIISQIEVWKWHAYRIHQNSDFMNWKVNQIFYHEQRNGKFYLELIQIHFRRFFGVVFLKCPQPPSINFFKSHFGLKIFFMPQKLPSALHLGSSNAFLQSLGTQNLLGSICSLLHVPWI